MAKGSAGDKSGANWRALLAAAVVEFGTRRVGPYMLTIPKRAVRAAVGDGALAVMDLPNGDRLVTYTPPPPVPRPKRGTTT